LFTTEYTRNRIPINDLWLLSDPSLDPLDGKINPISCRALLACFDCSYTFISSYQEFNDKYSGYGTNIRTFYQDDEDLRDAFIEEILSEFGVRPGPWMKWPAPKLPKILDLMPIFKQDASDLTLMMKNKAKNEDDQLVVFSQMGILTLLQTCV